MKFTTVLTAAIMMTTLAAGMSSAQDTFTTQLVTDHSSSHNTQQPRLNGDGTRVLYSSAGNPLGTNGDNNWEVTSCCADAGAGARPRPYAAELALPSIRPATIARDGSPVYPRDSTPRE